jgi:photosystem II stability/assembly factor-like uncharacterized protein
MRFRTAAIAALVAAACAAPAGHAAVEIDSNTFGGMQARAIGPAVMSGRVAALDAVVGDSVTVWVGAATGGVWKSRDGGVSFKPVFDDHTQSIGAIKVDPTNPDVVWVGTGESWTRNSVSVGNGVFRTEDGGDTWTRVGLEDSERIAAIVVHPSEPDTVYVCATGHLWDANEQRGVFRTVDGGKSWDHVLRVDDNTGCASLDIDPQEPSILYAGMWQFRRYPAFFESGGPGSGLYKTTDGGDEWKRLDRGLPGGELGRIAVAVAPSRPSVVYATVEAEDTALYRSEDLGESWTRVSNAPVVTGRPFYFSLLRVDPDDHDRVYKPGFTLGVSTDGGETFGGLGGGTHPDHHALWINPDDPRHLMLGTDGGLYISYDRGNTWRFVRDLPISQFYRVSYDLDFPYNVYGGLQDNGSWSGPSRSVGGIQNRDWSNVGFGDGFYTFRDPTDPDFVYSEYQGGNVKRLQRSTGEIQDIRPYEGTGDPDYRFNWNTPIHLSPSKQGRLYLGAQFLFRSDDRGRSWERISPDLTTDDPDKQRQEESGGLTIDNSTAENHCSIYAISESPRDERVIWVGTDDGNLQRTVDGGKTWKNVAGNVPGLPPGTWVSSVEAGRHADGTAYATFDGHRTGDMTPYVFRTTDHGETWESLRTDAIEGYALVVREDLEKENLIFLGTELGLYVTLDGGENWARFEGNIPKVGVRDIAVHPRDPDLIVGTHGRGIYILDDITPLRSLTQEALESDVALLPSGSAVMVIPASVQSWSGPDEFVGRNPPQAAWITYYLKKRHIFGDLKIEIRDADGTLLKTLPGGKRRGINRVAWPMRLKPPKVPPANALVPAFQGPRVAEGTYTVKLIKGKESVTGTVDLVPDPRTPHSAEDRAFQQQTSMRLYEMLERLTWVVDTLIELRDGAEERAKGLKEKDRLRDDLTGYAKGLETFRSSIVATSEAGRLSGEEKLREKLGQLYGNVVGYDGRPTDSQLARIEVLGQQLAGAVEAFETLAGSDLERVNSQLEKRELETLRLTSFEEWQEDKGS